MYRFIMLSCLLVVSCRAVPALPVAASAVVSVPEPAMITLHANLGVGATAGHVYVAATVQDGYGRVIPNALVTFEAVGGVVQPQTVLADPGGLAQAEGVWTGPGLNMLVIVRSGQATAVASVFVNR